ncbi:MAG: hydantoinase/oxoprolinase family protein [Novosphingobium sp.]|nr:hydantoinase/oxoprolinase family protein [Novosphingobium sp.]
MDPICFGIDVGGTFTDCVLTEGERIWRAKSPTTPGELGKGVIAAARLAAHRRGESLEATLPNVARFGLGTTAITNVLASRTGRRVGLVTTEGFEQMLPMARGAREIDEEGWLAAPQSVVDIETIAGVSERIDRNGDVITALDLAEAEAAIRLLVEDQQVEALAVSFLWAFLNPAHENAVTELARRLYPDVPVISAAELHPAAREFERTSFAVLNAYVSGALGGIEELEGELAAMGLTSPLLLVHSGGGSVTVAEAKRRPLGLAVSGPAAGVAASVAVGAAAGIETFVTCDLGGTSFDVSVIQHGQPARRTRGEVMGTWTALSLVDVASIGAGGGSLGWIDARGALRVGPRSAGAVPGPACYGRGGTEATVTDALVVLGYIDPENFLGGEFTLDAEAAQRACTKLGEALEMDAETIAWGIRQLALTDMIRATRGRTGALGLDLREHAFMCFGGSGALFVPDLARAVEAPRVLVPELASVLSAFGAASTDVRRERIRTVMTPFPLASARVEAVKSELAQSALADLEADGVAEADRSVLFEADIRFSKQISEIQLPVPDGPFDAAIEAELLDAFREEYAKRYGKGSIVLGAPIELVTLRAVGIGRTTRARVVAGALEEVAQDTDAQPVRSRSVRLERGDGGRRDIAVHDGAGLLPGHMLVGPALIDASDTTIWVPDGMSAMVNSQGTLVMESAS